MSFYLLKQMQSIMHLMKKMILEQMLEELNLSDHEDDFGKA